MHKIFRFVYYSLIFSSSLVCFPLYLYVDVFNESGYVSFSADVLCLSVLVQLL